MSCRYGDWEPYAELLYWVREVNPAKHRQIVKAIDWKQLEIRTNGLWTKPRREFRLLIGSLLVGRAGGPVRQWVTEHAAQIEDIDPIMAGVSPEAAVAVVRRGAV